MSQIQVEFDPATLALSQRGVHSGVLFLLVDGIAFPEQGWNDFVEIVLGWWCQGLRKATGPSAVAVVLPFMDGPFDILVHPVDEEGSSIIELRSGQGRNALWRYRIQLADLRREVLRAAESLLKHVSGTHGDGPATAELRKQAAALDELQRQSTEA